jgi:hypothetical protein
MKKLTDKEIIEIALGIAEQGHKEAIQWVKDGYREDE